MKRQFGHFGLGTLAFFLELERELEGMNLDVNWEFKRMRELGTFRVWEVAIGHRIMSNDVA